MFNDFTYIYIIYIDIFHVMRWCMENDAHNDSVRTIIKTWKQKSE